MRFNIALLLPLAVLQGVALAAPVEPTLGNAEVTTYTVEDATAQGLLPAEGAATKDLVTRDNIPKNAHKAYNFVPSIFASKPTRTLLTINGVTVFIVAWYVNIYSMMYRLEGVVGQSHPTFLSFGLLDAVTGIVGPVIRHDYSTIYSISPKTGQLMQLDNPWIPWWM
ncbi:hypothetical protein BDZ85DRAFT_83296 [Elsinoe ampelina]|uniref:Uncharacterized protein n=1 Tax=Elsinoe ampelina TaxID=302913 RepID=A0A6A6GGG9_9PEZI|nr:hypothetical protein BDZ85DRAFT_83296 [Elsinoe ampelina]